MAGSLNKVMLIGNLGADPEIRSFQNGGKVANLRIATSETWKDRNTGERQERTEWHTVAIFSEVSGGRGRTLPAQGFEGLYRRPAADPQMAGPVGQRPLFDRSGAARPQRHADHARRRPGRRQWRWWPARRRVAAGSWDQGGSSGGGGQSGGWNQGGGAQGGAGIGRQRGRSRRHVQTTTISTTTSRSDGVGCNPIYS